MQFKETNTNDLYDSTVRAFPKTTKRQHATDPVEISAVNFTPYLGMKTLYIRSLAQNEGKEYNLSILFRNIIYNENGLIDITDILLRFDRFKGNHAAASPFCCQIPCQLNTAQEFGFSRLS